MVGGGEGPLGAAVYDLGVGPVEMYFRAAAVPAGRLDRCAARLRYSAGEPVPPSQPEPQSDMISSLRSFHPYLSILLCLFLAAPAASAARPDVGTIHSHLDRAEKNLELVNGSIGHLKTPPKGSAAKLAKLRLEQADADLKPAGELVAKLGEGPGVAEAKARYDEAVALRDKLEGILTGTPPEPKPEPKPEPEPKPGDDPKPEPQPTPEPEEPPAEKTVKLGYPHADNFKNALFTLRRVEGDSAGITKIVEELKPQEDQLAIDHRRTASALATLTEARRQAGFVDDGLAKIPANGEGVAEAKERLATARAELDTAEAYLEPLNGKLLKLIDPSGYPDFQADLKRLRELGASYANPEVLFRDQRARAAEAFEQSEAAKAECVRIARAYVRLMEQQTEMGKQIEAAGNGFLSRHEAFLAAAGEQRASLPADVRADMAEADRLADDAVKNQKPLWFTGGIPQRMEWVEDKLALYEALDPAAAPALRREVEELKGSLRERADSLRELIIRENELPPDRYAGTDRDAAIAVAVDGWKVQEKDAEVLAVRIPSEAWTRETKWTYSNGTWYFSDRSTLQVRLLVADKKNPELAIDRAINVKKDHQKGDTMIGVPLRSFDEELQPSEYLLRSKVK